jgi:putative transposase
MSRVLDPFRFVLISLAGWMNQRQLRVIDYLREENLVLREQLGDRRLRLNDDQLLKGKRYLIHDRDPLFTAEFLNILAETGVASVRIPPRSPNLDAHAERFVRSLKESCLERMILFGEASVRKATTEFVAHYHLERNHQGL